MKNLLAIFLSLSMLICLSGCENVAGSEEVSSSSVDDISSIASEYTLDELNAKIQPKVTELFDSRIEYDSDWEYQFDNDYISFDDFDESYTGVDNVYDYFNAILTAKCGYIHFFDAADYLGFGIVSDNSEFIQRAARLFASLELKEISSEEFRELTYPPNRQFYSVHTSDYFRSLKVGFYGTTSFTLNLFIHEDIPSDNLLQSDYYISLNSHYFVISNFEEIKDEFLEVYAICKYVCDMKQELELSSYNNMK